MRFIKQASLYVAAVVAALAFWAILIVPFVLAPASPANSAHTSQYCYSTPYALSAACSTARGDKDR